MRSKAKTQQPTTGEGIATGRKGKTILLVPRVVDHHRPYHLRLHCPPVFQIPPSTVIAGNVLRHYNTTLRPVGILIKSLCRVAEDEVTRATMVMRSVIPRYVSSRFRQNALKFSYRRSPTLRTRLDLVHEQVHEQARIRLHQERLILISGCITHLQLQAT